MWNFSARKMRHPIISFYWDDVSTLQTNNSNKSVANNGVSWSICCQCFFNCTCNSFLQHREDFSNLMISWKPIASHSSTHLSLKLCDNSDASIIVILTVGCDYLLLELRPLTGPLPIPQVIHEWIWRSGGIMLIENQRTLRKTIPVTHFPPQMPLN